MSNNTSSAPVYALKDQWGHYYIIMWGPSQLAIVERAPRAREKFRVEVFGKASTHATPEAAMRAGIKRARRIISEWKMPTEIFEE